MLMTLPVAHWDIFSDHFDELKKVTSRSIWTWNAWRVSPKTHKICDKKNCFVNTKFWFFGEILNFVVIRNLEFGKFTVTRRSNVTLLRRVTVIFPKITVRWRSNVTLLRRVDVIFEFDKLLFNILFKIGSNRQNFEENSFNVRDIPTTNWLVELWSKVEHGSAPAPCPTHWYLRWSAKLLGTSPTYLWRLQRSTGQCQWQSPADWSRPTHRRPESLSSETSPTC